MEVKCSNINDAAQNYTIMQNLKPKNPIDFKLLWKKVINQQIAFNKIDREKLKVKKRRQLVNEKQIIDDVETKKHPWISCIGQLQAISQEFEQCNEILNNVKNSKFPNPVLFLINNIDYISSIRNGICDYISYATKALGDLMIGNEHDNINAKDSFVEHDPGNRIHNLTILQRQFLISLGPHQPKLARYPRDNNILVNKQQHFTPIWFNEFPMLEYTIVADSVFFLSVHYFLK
ncbi:uncharacterized protein LOC136075543 [Hydra vulgaris]|uniref:Uncharacterized protein LOC136075543 n=1 Tax=Hydra vulgaris TaxID=6087 RepID=A0ABM4B872_HYDVU